MVLRKFENRPASTLNKIFLGLISIYRGLFSVWFGGHCRFEPSCSCYAEQAFKTLSFAQAVNLVTKRLIKCRPGGTFGLDPVPRAENRTQG